MGLLDWSGLGAESSGGEWGAGAAHCGEEVAGGISNHGYSDVKGNWEDDAVKLFLAAMADDIIEERGKFGLDIRKKKSCWGGVSISPSREVSSIGQTRPGCPDLLLATVLLQERLDQRPPEAPFTHVLLWVRAPVPSVPPSLL